MAESAGRVLLEVRAGDAGDDPTALRDRGDRVSHEHLVRALAQHFPDDAVLSEEGADDHARLTARRVWIVDPLDGTREFSEAGRDDWAVHVALWENGELAAGAVGMPARDIVHATDRPPTVPERDAGPLRLAVSRSRPPEFVARLAEQMDAVLVHMGSAGVKVMSVIDGTSDAYIHAGGQFEWDSAAPVAVARACGLHTSRIDGSALSYNQENPYLPDLLVCRRERAAAVLAAIKAV